MARFNDVPFNFVPLNREVFIPSWGKDISQDIPFKDGEDGIIRFTITNTTPLFIKDSVDKEDPYSAHIKVKDSDGNPQRLYYIPATSIKGMLRSVMEIISFAEMKEKVNYTNDFFGFRDFDDEEYKRLMGNVSCGWLKKSVKGSEEQYSLIDCGIPESIEMTDADMPSCYNRDEDAVKKAQTFKDQVGEYYPILPNGKHLVCSGKMFNKKYEQVFPEPIADSEAVDNNTVEAFLSVYKPSRSYYPFILKMLDEGKPLAVFFVRGDNRKVDAIGLTRNFRYPYKHPISYGVTQDNYHNEDSRDLLNRQDLPDLPDLPACIFGYISKERSLKGRIQVGNAFPINGEMIEIPQDQIVTGVLGQPKASYYPYYIKQQIGTGRKTYSSDHFEIAGRKRYRVHSPQKLTRIPSGNDTGENKITILPIPANHSFTCEIKVHNLRTVEIGALLSSLMLFGLKGCHHNIGMAKGMGYGRIEISQLELISLNHKTYHYIKAFIDCMNKFKADWLDSEQIKILLSIASDHTTPLGYMVFEQYKQGKQNHSLLLSENDNIEYKNKILNTLNYGLITELMEDAKYEEAKQLIDSLGQTIHDPRLGEYTQIIKKHEEETKRREREELAKRCQKQIWDSIRKKEEKKAKK